METQQHIITSSDVSSPVLDVAMKVRQHDWTERPQIQMDVEEGRQCTTVPLRTESRFTGLKWGVAYLRASSVMVTQPGSSGQPSATFSASPSNWQPSTPPDMGGWRNRSQKSKQSQSNMGLLYVRRKACDKWNELFSHTERGVCVWRRVWFGSDFSAVILWEGLLWH